MLPCTRLASLTCEAGWIRAVSDELSSMSELRFARDSQLGTRSYKRFGPLFPEFSSHDGQLRLS